MESLYVYDPEEVEYTSSNVANKSSAVPTCNVLNIREVGIVHSSKGYLSTLFNPSQASEYQALLLLMINQK